MESINNYQIVQILNHNVVLLSTKDNIELLAFGKGIGFQRKVGDKVTADSINKLYTINDYKNRKDYQDLLQNSQEAILDVSEEIIFRMKQTFGSRYNERIHISLLDHLNFAIKRCKENIIIGNVFLEELEFMYAKEYEFSKKALAYINQMLDVTLPQSEIGYICMHIHSALAHIDVGTSVLINSVIQDILTFLTEEKGIIFHTYHLKQRLITHIKFALKRYVDNIHLENPMSDIVFKKYKKAAQIASDIDCFLQGKYAITFTEDELAYLTVHIQNIIIS